jgi:hypothetical protein
MALLLTIFISKIESFTCRNLRRNNFFFYRRSSVVFSIDTTLVNEKVPHRTWSSQHAKVIRRRFTCGWWKTCWMLYCRLYRFQSHSTLANEKVSRLCTLVHTSILDITLANENVHCFQSYRTCIYHASQMRMCIASSRTAHVYITLINEKVSRQNW